MVLNGKVGVVDNTRHSAPGLGVRARALVVLRRFWAGSPGAWSPGTGMGCHKVYTEKQHYYTVYGIICVN